MSDTVVEKATTPNALEWQARCTVGAATNLSHWVKTTLPEKLGWEASTGPESKTRSISEQMRECIRVNLRMARWLKDDNSELPEANALDSAEEIGSQLRSSAEELASVIRSLQAEDIDRVYQTAWGPLTGREMMVIPMANMYYHGGQVNYIQTLYGDTDFSFPD